MTTGQPTRRLKIAFIHMPINAIRPPVSSTGVAVSLNLIVDEIARRLARSHDVIEYSARGEGQQKVERVDGVEYRRVSTCLDTRLLHHEK
jgi:hypothetical protein